MFEFLFGRKSKPTRLAPPSQLAKLRVEQLEDRVTPANLTFTGLRDNFMSQWNWYDTTNNAYVVPNPNDDLYFVGNQSPGDHTYLPVPMTAPAGSPEYMMMVMQGMPVNEPFRPNRNVTIPIIQNVLPEVRGVHLVSNYTQVDNLTGHVSVYDGQRLGRLELRTGFFDQLGSNSDVYIGINFDFTGGTLNSTTDLGDVVHLTGNISLAGVASANLLPPEGGLTLGSTISVEGLGTAGFGAGMAIYKGNIAVANGADLITNQFCITEVGKARPLAPPGQPPFTFDPAQVTFTIVGAGAKQYTRIVVGTDGVGSFIGNYEGAAKLFAFGKISISSGVTVKLTDPVDPVLASVMVQEDAMFSIANSGKLIAPHDVVVAGIFRTLYVDGLTVPQTAIVEGNLIILAAGTLKLTDGAMADQFGRLVVIGEIAVAGTIQMEVNGAVNGETESPECDIIATPKSLTFLAGSKLKIASTNATAPMRVNRTWNLVDALDKVLGNVPVPTGRFAATKQQADVVLEASYLGE